MPVTSKQIMNFSHTPGKILVQPWPLQFWFFSNQISRAFDHFTQSSFFMNIFFFMLSLPTWRFPDTLYEFRAWGGRHPNRTEYNNPLLVTTGRGRDSQPWGGLNRLSLEERSGTEVMFEVNPGPLCYVVADRGWVIFCTIKWNLMMHDFGIKI